MIKGFGEYLQSTADKKNPFVPQTSMIQYPTGYMYLDYGTGSYLTVCNDDEVPIYQYHNIGLVSGSVNTIISKSQGGKTTLALGMGQAIIEPYVTTMLYLKAVEDAKRVAGLKSIPDLEGYPMIEVLDTEKTLPVDYAKKVTRYTNKLTDRHISIVQITTDKDLMEMVNKHIQFKVAHMKKIPMPMLDMFGRVIYEYPPTVLIVDSMSQVLLENCDDAALIEAARSGKVPKGGIMDIYASSTQNVAGARRAKIITALYSQLVNYAKRYNIIIFCINHINKTPPINGVPTKQYRGLRMGETINGGERAIYLTSTILRLDVIKNIGGVSSTAVNLGEGITGHIAIASWIKSKSNSKSNKCQLAYTNQGGYDPLLSNLWNGKETGDLKKAGNFFHLEDLPQYKFTLKNYRDVFAEHPEMFTTYYDELRRKCSVLLDNPEEAFRSEKQLISDIRDDIHNDYDGSRGDVMDMDDMFASMYNM